MSAADVQRDLADVIDRHAARGTTVPDLAAALLPAVQRLIERAEKRAAAAAVRWAANDVHMPYEIRMELHARATSLDPANATREVSS